MIFQCDQTSLSDLQVRPRVAHSDHTEHFGDVGKCCGYSGRRCRDAGRDQGSRQTPRGCRQTPRGRRQTPQGHSAGTQADTRDAGRHLGDTDSTGTQRGDAVDTGDAGRQDPEAESRPAGPGRNWHT